jgi:hypothetical protein
VQHGVTAAVGPYTVGRCWKRSADRPASEVMPGLDSGAQTQDTG